MGFAKRSGDVLISRTFIATETGTVEMWVIGAVRSWWHRW